MFFFVSSIILTKIQALIALSFVQVTVTLMQQVFGGPGAHCIVLRTITYMKLIHIMLKCLVFDFSLSLEKCPIKDISVV